MHHCFVLAEVRLKACYYIIGPFFVTYQVGVWYVNMVVT